MSKRHILSLEYDVNNLSRKSFLFVTRTSGRFLLKHWTLILKSFVRHSKKKSKLQMFVWTLQSLNFMEINTVTEELQKIRKRKSTI